MMPPLSEWTVWITGFVGRVPAFDSVMSIIVSDFLIPVSIALIMLGLWVGYSNPVRRSQIHRTIMGASVSIGISTLVVFLINSANKFWPRPYDVTDPAVRDAATHAAQTIFYLPHDPSFPSNAATITFAAATGVWFGNRKAGALLYALASLWVLARFYGGIHFFVDILGGAIIGTVTAVLICKVFMPATEPLPTWALRLARFLYIA
ncbi:MAG: phosphatase PAP2 family protein [Dehalococcoidia bacterium]|nr:phosphatase PAP2 family protein [Dehalococcoidia bacterium]